MIKVNVDFPLNKRKTYGGLRKLKVQYNLR